MLSVTCIHFPRILHGTWYTYSTHSCSICALHRKKNPIKWCFSVSLLLLFYRIALLSKIYDNGTKECTYKILSVYPQFYLLNGDFGFNYCIEIEVFYSSSFIRSCKYIYIICLHAVVYSFELLMQYIKLKFSG